MAGHVQLGEEIIVARQPRRFLPYQNPAFDVLGGLTVVSKLTCLLGSLFESVPLPDKREFL